MAESFRSSHSLRKKIVAGGIAAAGLLGSGYAVYEIGNDQSKIPSEQRISTENDAFKHFTEGKGGLNEQDIRTIKESIKVGGNVEVLNGSIIHKFTDSKGEKMQWTLAYPVISAWQKGPVDFKDISQYFGHTYIVREGEGGEAEVSPASLKSTMEVVLNDPNKPLISGVLKEIEDLVNSPNVDTNSYGMLAGGHNSAVIPVSTAHFGYASGNK